MGDPGRASRPAEVAGTMKKKLCLHNIDEYAAQGLESYDLAGHTTTRDDLRTAIGTTHFDGLVIDLDDRDAVNAVVEALEQRPNLIVIGVIGTNDVNKAIAAQRAGCSQLATKPLEPGDLKTALSAAFQSDQSNPNCGSRTVALIGSTGGAGTTTVACYLAMALAERAEHVGLMDMDFEFGGVAKAWDLNPKYTIEDLLQFEQIERQSLEDVMIELPSGVFVLPRPRNIKDTHKIDADSLQAVFEAMRAMFPYVVLDLPRRLDQLTGCAIENCDKLLIVTQQTVNGVFNAARLGEGLIDYGIEESRIEFVLNRYNKRVHQVTVNELTKRVRKSPLALIPNHYKSIGQASDLGEPVTDSNPVRKAIGELADAMFGERGKTSSGSWMSSLGLKK